MKALFRLAGVIGLACLGSGTLSATQYLVTIQAENNQYLCAENGGGSYISANRNYAGSWETFVIDDSRGNGNGWSISIKSTENPKFLCWNNQQYGSQWSSYYGFYLYGYYNGPSLVINRDYAGSWETFYLVDPWGAGISKPLDSGWIYTKISVLNSWITTYLRAANGGGGAMGGMGGDLNSTHFTNTTGWTGTRFAVTVLAVLE